MKAPADPSPVSTSPLNEAGALLFQLAKRYPEQFSEHHLDIQPVQGWILLFARLCAEVSQLAQNAGGHVQWLQIKDKLGSMRAHYKIAPVLDEVFAQDLRDKVSVLCEQARAASETCCQICCEKATRPAHPLDSVLCELHLAQQMQSPEQFERDLKLRINREAAQIASFQKKLLLGLMK